MLRPCSEERGFFAMSTALPASFVMGAAGRLGDSMADPWHMSKNCLHKGHRMGFYVPYVDICHRSATIAFSSMQSKTAQAQGLVM